MGIALVSGLPVGRVQGIEEDSPADLVCRTQNPTDIPVEPLQRKVVVISTPQIHHRWEH